jgi:hypothetical protein
MTTYSISAQTIQIELELVKGNNWPQWNIEQDFQILSEKETSFKKTVIVLLENFENQLVINRGGKNDNETIVENRQIVRDQTLTISRLWVNDVLIEMSIIQRLAKFYPIYSESNISYAKEHNIELSNVRNDLSLFYNGRWVVEFEQPFFIFYNHLLFEYFQGFNHWVRQTHLGIAGDQKLLKLNQLLKLLS